MKLIAFVVFILFNLLSKAYCQNFCDPSLCPAGITQIGCNNPGTLNSSCPAGAAMVNLTTVMKQQLVQAINIKRNQIAAGNLTGFLPATRMATIRWNADLATLAGFNAMTCVYAHDLCRATLQFPWSGQNIAKAWWSAGSPDLMSVMLARIDGWWSEYTVTTMANINSYPASTAQEIGHFTVMTSEKNTAVGCAAVTYNDPAENNWASLTLVCNFARTNIVGVKMYTTGVTAANCTTGRNPNYPALCSLSEPYNIKLA